MVLQNDYQYVPKVFLRSLISGLANSGNVVLLMLIGFRVFSSSLSAALVALVENTGNLSRVKWRFTTAV